MSLFRVHSFLHPPLPLSRMVLQELLAVKAKRLGYRGLRAAATIPVSGRAGVRYLLQNIDLGCLLCRPMHLVGYPEVST